MKTSWEHKEGMHTEYIYVNYNEVVVGDHWGSGLTDNAGACSHEEFLTGRYQDLILERFGQEILDEVILAVKNANRNPEFQKKKKEILERKYFLDTIPLDESLKGLDKHPKTISGYMNYGNAGGYKTIVKSDNLTMFIESQDGYLESYKKKRIYFTLEGHCSGAVELHDYFYIVYNDNFAVISPTANIIFDTHNLKFDLTKAGFDPSNMMFGYTVRISNVYRHKEIIFIRCRFFNNDYNPNLIKFDLKKGLCGRWEVED